MKSRSSADRFIQNQLQQGFGHDHEPLLLGTTEDLICVMRQSQKLTRSERCTHSRVSPIPRHAVCNSTANRLTDGTLTLGRSYPGQHLVLRIKDRMNLDGAMFMVFPMGRADKAEADVRGDRAVR